MICAADRTQPFSDTEIFDIGILIPTASTSLTAWIESWHFNYLSSIESCFVFKQSDLLMLRIQESVGEESRYPQMGVSGVPYNARQGHQRKHKHPKQRAVSSLNTDKYRRAYGNIRLWRPCKTKALVAT